ncbi:MAG: GNAT family N-acetyltransferase [Prevotellaceae bacterium]|jgi:ribosomal protein S18 acetylase RimI-like enzyme|nr:GNAT family N-acetyltransferase [Prevotellaceae bacterium]
MKSNISDLSFARSLYEAAFPLDERREFDDLINVAETKSAFRTEIFRQNTDLSGFIFYWKFSMFVYVEHFAVAEHLRNRGLGREIFQNFCDKTVLPIVLEVEKPDNEIAARRIRFYEKFGFAVSEITYLQPAYSTHKYPVPMLLMQRGEVGIEKCVELLRKEVYEQD